MSNASTLMPRVYTKVTPCHPSISGWLINAQPASVLLVKSRALRRDAGERQCQFCCNGFGTDSDNLCLIPSRVQSMTLKLVFTASLLYA